MADTPVLIVALDLPSLADAKALVQRLRPITPWFKIGSMLFTSVGPDAVRMVHEAGGQVFLDLKFHDIPQTIAGGVAAAAELGVALVTVHCAAGPAALAAAVAARSPGSSLKLLGVTRLTSEAGRVGASVIRAALAARDAGLDGVTASVRECARIKGACGTEFRVLTPGIRPAGADYLVVGRPIVAAPDPAAAAQAVWDEITSAARRRRSAAQAAARSG